MCVFPWTKNKPLVNERHWVRSPVQSKYVSSPRQKTRSLVNDHHRVRNPAQRKHVSSPGQRTSLSSMIASGCVIQYKANVSLPLDKNKSLVNDHHWVRKPVQGKRASSPIQKTSLYSLIATGCIIQCKANMCLPLDADVV